MAASYAEENNPQEDERLLKTAYIYNFAKFTRWPEQFFPQPDSPLNLCTMGQDDLVDELKNLQDKIIKGHPLSVSSIRKASEAAAKCQVIYIAQSEKNRYQRILRAVRNRPVLTLSEIASFASNGGIIQFYRKKGQMRLIINLNATHRAGLEISSRLLILAKIIGGKDS